MVMLKVIGDRIGEGVWAYFFKKAHTHPEGNGHIYSQKRLFYILLHRSYAQYQINTQYDELIDYDEWCKQLVSEHP